MALEPQVKEERPAVVRYLDQLLRYLLILTMGTLTVSVFIQVLVRFVFRVPIPWTEEVARIAFVYSVYLGAILGMRDRAHINVDIVLSVVPPGVRRVMELVGSVLVAIFLIFLTWQGVVFVMATGTQTTPVMELPFRYVFTMLPISGALMLLYLVLRVVDDLRARRAP
jgi:TRAP-type transport system small permease protein